ncbi:MAG TPA: DUF1080 domain-containing protein [Gemmataceae bacterium]|nr:DUF1080 domain-containing protein [Gemmataceae bacterium]
MRFAILLALALLPTLRAGEPNAAETCQTEWVPLFNGKNLDGWTPKITGYEAGVNHGDTFRVKDGVLCVSYDKYDEFGTKFGHLFYKDTFSHYVLRVEYRFLGEQAKGGPGWAVRNSGVMFHAQSPQSMRKDQEFPVSIEAQFLGGVGRGARSTGNVCTPGTNMVMGGKLVTQHCTNSKSKTFNGDDWVTAEIEVNGGGKVVHRINGDVVLEYEQPQLDPKDEDGKKLIKDGKLLLESGYIALQAESHPCEFRKVEIKVLKK